MKIEDIKAMLPEQLMGMKRSNFNATTAMGFASGEAEYTKVQSKMQRKRST
ncbi:MAG: hypothetical protein JWN78_716 [Bacteroidota bacterium]|nr:hypothetical protein [Bacteroidota bacterium]